MLDKQMPPVYLVCIDPNTNKIVERYVTAKTAVKLNEGYNYNSLLNAICKHITYKGYKWEWIDVTEDNPNNSIEDEFRNEVHELYKLMKQLYSTTKITK